MLSPGKFAWAEYVPAVTVEKVQLYEDTLEEFGVGFETELVQTTVPPATLVTVQAITPAGCNAPEPVTTAVKVMDPPNAGVPLWEIATVGVKLWIPKVTEFDCPLV